MIESSVHEHLAPLPFECLLTVTIFTAEGMLERLASQQGSSTVAHFDRTFIPAERAGNEEDMGGTIVYMASKAGAYLNGVVLVIDGGRLSIVPAAY